MMVKTVDEQIELLQDSTSNSSDLIHLSFKAAEQKILLGIEWRSMVFRNAL